MSDLYAVLGVPRDATPEQIKAAYRRCSSAAHPDKEGGSVERMQAVNQANDVLSDPERRARYDATGEDGGENNLETMAIDLLQSTFNAALDKDAEPIAHATAHIVTVMAKVQMNKDNTEVELKKMLKRQRKTKRRSEGRNLVEELIEQRIAGAKRSIALYDEGLRSAALASAMLAEYIPDPDDKPIDTRTELQKAQQRFAEDAVRSMTVRG